MSGSQPGEFTKLFQKALETVDLIFSDGIDWQAFLFSLKELQTQEENINVQAIERKSGGAFIVRLEVPSDANKAEIESKAKQLYDTELKILEARYRAELDSLEVNYQEKIITIHKEQNASLEGIIHKLADSPPNIFQIQGNNMAGDRNTNQSRNLNISDNAQVNASGAGALSLGDISGIVANTINQLPNFDDEPNKKELKELLSQLQSAVLEEDLDDDDKEETLKQINAIAEALKNSQDGTVKKTAKKAMKMLRGIAADLPKGAAMVTICNQLPDLISKIF